MLIRCRPKSSITSVPQLLLSCSGASQMPVEVLRVTSRLSIVSSPPTTIVGRRMRIQRLSILRLSSSPPVLSSGRLLVVAGVVEADDLAVDADRAGNPDVLAERLRDALGDARLAVAGGAVEEQPAAGVDRRAEPGEHSRIDEQIGEGPAQIVGGGVLRR